MTMKEIYPSLYQFTLTIPGMGFTIHQYLLNGEAPVLFATGIEQQAVTILKEIKIILGEKQLEYIFVSHMESDECGGLPVFMEAYPDVKVICSELTVRELSGFGVNVNTIACNSKAELKDRNLDLKFIDYPSEVHLQNGIIAIDRNSGVLYSGDLFLSFGEAAGICKETAWETEINALDEQRVPNAAMCDKIKAELRTLRPKFVAVGHGFCLKLPA